MHVSERKRQQAFINFTNANYYVRYRVCGHQLHRTKPQLQLLLHCIFSGTRSSRVDLLPDEAAKKLQTAKNNQLTGKRYHPSTKRRLGRCKTKRLRQPPYLRNRHSS